MKIFKFVIGACAVLLLGCGGTSTTEIQTVTENEVQIPTINPPKTALAKLVPVSRERLLQSQQNGLFYQSVSSVNSTDNEMVAASEVSTSRNYSQTITQELGVDESDIIKYDGEKLFVLTTQTPTDFTQSKSDKADFTSPGFYYPEEQIIRVLEKQPNKELIQTHTLSFVDTNNDIRQSEIYITDNKVITIGKSAELMYFDQRSIYVSGAPKFSIDLHELENTGQTLPSFTFTGDGRLLSSRRIGDKIILISSFANTPNVPLATSDVQKAEVLSTIKELDIFDFLPQYSLEQNGQLMNGALVNANSCFIPENQSLKDGTLGLVTITSLDINDPNNFSSICVNGWFDDVYVSAQDIFLYATTEGFSTSNQPQNSTVVHHFELNPEGKSQYNGTAFARGTVGWQNPQLRFKQEGENLFLVTTEFTADVADRFDHYLSVFSLNANDRELRKIGQLPDLQSSIEIGKPNEDITAVRFFDNKVYIVTFERIDPLYVIDLSNPARPLIQGELEMPGYSSYLHPLNENYVLGIGQNIDPNRFLEPPNSQTMSEEAIQEGTKIALFDVSGIPRIVNEYVFPESGTPAEFSYKALTYLAKSETEHWFAVPIQTYTYTINAEGLYEDTGSTFMALFSADLEGKGRLLNPGNVAPDFTSDDGYGNYNDRAVIDEETIYYVHHGKVWRSSWNNPQIVFGPY